MAVAARPVPRRAEAWLLALLLVWGAVVFGAGLRIWKLADSAAISNFALVFGSLLVEAVPFVLLGAIVSSLIEVFVPVRFFEKLARFPRPIQLPASALMGVAFPVCECGSVPVARRMMTKGLTPSAAITFMLAAPIVNPVVVMSTFLAYRGRTILWPMVIGRVGLGLVVAMLVGWALRKKEPGKLLRATNGAGHDHCAVGDSRKASFFGHVAQDFLFMGRYLVFGAAVAAAMQTYVPQSVIGGVAAVPVLSVLALMGLAFVLSLCSESDAFVAASFVQFGFAPQLAFLVFGPMLDTKLTFLYSGSFSRRLVLTLVAVVSLATLTGALLIQAVAL